MRSNQRPGISLLQVKISVQEVHGNRQWIASRLCRIQAILAESFGAIYERNAINAGFPVLTYKDLSILELKNRDTVIIDLEKETILNKRNNRNASLSPISPSTDEDLQKGDLLVRLKIEIPDMKGKTFAEKIFGAPAGIIVFRKPDIVLTHDNTVEHRKHIQENGR